MASACVNNISENFPTAAYPSYGWLSPRISFSRDAESKSQQKSPSPAPATVDPAVESQDPDKSFDFEFRLDDPVASTMISADELFSDGKLMPLHLNTKSQSSTVEVRSPENVKINKTGAVSGSDPHLFSPKAPRCSSRWREILGLKKLYQNASKSDQKTKLITNNATKHKRSILSSSNDVVSYNLPLLKDCDVSSESLSVSSSRLSLSSSSSGHEHDLHDDLPRLSLDSDKTSGNPFLINRTGQGRIRTVRAKPQSRGVSVDSPRMNSSGKIVFQSLERSSSSPSTFNGGPRLKHRGTMERSYSANVRVTPVLNVPVCSLRGSSKSFNSFTQLFSSSTTVSASPQKRDTSSTRTTAKNRT
ncbi:hypothetical protein ACFE04_025047 [Oxalis oulophora]